MVFGSRTSTPATTSLVNAVRGARSDLARRLETLEVPPTADSVEALRKQVPRNPAAGSSEISAAV